MGAMDALQHWLLQNYKTIALAVLLVLIILKAFVIYTINKSLKREFRRDDEPAFQTLGYKGVWRAASLRQGVLYPAQSNARSEATATHDVLVHGCRVDKSRLHDYLEICRHNCEDAIPLCFLETLFMKYLVMLAVSKKCRVSPQGLIHIRQTVTVHCDLTRLLDSEFSLHASVLEYRQVARGVEVDVGMEVLFPTEAGSERVWSGVATLLSRCPQAQRSGQTQTSRREQSQTDLGEHSRCELTVPGDLGLRFARVSGDWNLHHLYPWTARILGYRAPIAHGMWTLARALAEIQAHPDPGITLRYPVQVEAAFKRPLFMPGQAVILHGRQGDGRGYWFQVVDKETGAPHVIGSMQSP